MNEGHAARTMNSSGLVLVVYKAPAQTRLICGWPASGAVTPVLLDKALPFYSELRQRLAAGPAFIQANEGAPEPEWCCKAQAFLFHQDVDFELVTPPT